MTEQDNPWGDPAFENAVRETAYFLWEQDGRPSGREQEYWYRALEQRLRQRQADIQLREEPVHAHQIDDNQDDLGHKLNGATPPARNAGDSQE